MNLLTTQCNYSNLHLIITHFITILPRVTNTRRQRERGGGSWLAWEKGLGLKARSYRRPSSHSLPLARLRRRRPTKVGGRARSAWAGAGADAALAATLVKLSMDENSHCACLDSILVYRVVCTLVRQVLCVNTIQVVQGRQLDTLSKSH